MAPIPFPRLFGSNGRRAVESIVARRTFEDVILPPATRHTINVALAEVTQHDLIFNRWGLGERRSTGLALAFNFAGPPGTGDPRRWIEGSRIDDRARGGEAVLDAERAEGRMRGPGNRELLDPCNWAQLATSTADWSIAPDDRCY